MFPKISYTLQVIPFNEKWDSGHVLKTGHVGAGELMEFDSADKARKYGKAYSFTNHVYLEKNIIFSEKEDDFKTEVEEKPI